MSSLTQFENCEADHAAQLTTPQPIYNRPGLSALNYRVGESASFRRSMLLALNAASRASRDGQPAPLQTWSARGSDDYGIALLEMWAYLADILTFYQERIANESFLRTAILRESLLRLVSLLDYRANPGVAATVDLVFTLQEGATTLLPRGLRVQSVPGQDEQPQKFETSAALQAYARWNQLTPQARHNFQFGDRQVYLEGLKTGLKPGDALLLVGETRTAKNAGSERWDFRILTGVEPLPDRNMTLVTWEKGLGKQLDDYQITPEPGAEVFAFKRRVALFGHNAPDWRLIKQLYLSDGSVATLTNTPITLYPPAAVQTIYSRPQHGSVVLTNQGSVMVYLPALNFTGADSFVVRLAENNDLTVRLTVASEWPDFEIASPTVRVIDLDNVYPGIVVDGWVVLSRVEPEPYVELYRVKEADAANRLDYRLNAKVTRLKLDTSENLGSFGLRQTTVFAESQKLVVAETIHETLITNNTISVNEDVSDMEPGRAIIIAGVTADTGAIVSETAVVKDADANGQGTLLTLTDSLKNRYLRRDTVVFANVARATHGETVANEVLGSGDSTVPFQTFQLKKSPVTYIPQTGAPNGAASTLAVRVNDILWQEVPSHYRQAGGSAVYTTSIDNDGQMTIRLGDSQTGARAATGRNNVVATYRQGLGRAGMVRANTLKTLLDRPLGLKNVINPQPAAGGVDAESLAEIRVNAPNTVRTFGRITSLRDFADAARDFTGVAKARAVWAWDNQEQVVLLTVAGDRGDLIMNTPTYANLLADLNSRRDPNRKMRLQDYTAVPVLLTATVYVDPVYLPEKVGQAVRQAVIDYFDFDRVDLGQSIFLSDIYRLMQDVAGVTAVDIDRFCVEDSTRPGQCRPAGTPTDEVQALMGLRPNQIVCLQEPAKNLQLTTKVLDS